MDKTEVIQLEVKVNEHSAPGSVHWITDIDAKKQDLFDAADNERSHLAYS